MVEQVALHKAGQKSDRLFFSFLNKTIRNLSKHKPKKLSA